MAPSWRPAKAATWCTTWDWQNISVSVAETPRPATHTRLAEIEAPTLVVVATHDPPGLKAADRRVASEVPGARLVEVDSDHYLTLREPEQVSELLREFLLSASPQ